MEIKKFEAYNYSGLSLRKASRKIIIDELIDILTDAKIYGYESNGITYNSKDEILWLHVDKKENGKYIDDLIIKLDLSDMGIEIGTAEWGDDKEEFGEFVPEVNLDTDITKQLKNYKKNIKNYNL